MKYQGLIFDFNGVLWWDSHLQERAWREFASRLGGREFTLAEMMEHMHGRTNRQVLSYVTGRDITGVELYELARQKEVLYRQLCLDEGDSFRLSPGAESLLDFLVAHDVPHTIATASEKDNLDFFVEHLHLERWFNLDLIVYDDGSRPGKPAPDIYRAAAERLGLAPTDCVVVEDARSGIAAARAADIGCIVALGPQNHHEELRRWPGVDQVITSLAELDARGLLACRAGHASSGQAAV